MPNSKRSFSLREFEFGKHSRRSRPPIVSAVESPGQPDSDRGGGRCRCTEGVAPQVGFEPTTLRL